MSRAEKDVICRDLAGIERFVAFGSDIPKGWEVVRESEKATVAPGMDVPRTIGNVDAADERARRLEGDLERARSTEEAARDNVVDPANAESDAPAEPVVEAPAGETPADPESDAPAEPVVEAPAGETPADPEPAPDAPAEAEPAVETPAPEPEPEPEPEAKPPAKVKRRR